MKKHKNDYRKHRGRFHNSPYRTPGAGTRKQWNRQHTNARSNTANFDFYDATWKDHDRTNASMVKQIMTSLAIPTSYTRLILLGYCLNVLPATIIIAATLWTGIGIFTTRSQEHVYWAKMKSAREQFSDLLAYHNAFVFWKMNYAERDDTDDGIRKHEELNWANETGVSLHVLSQVKYKVEYIEKRLASVIGPVSVHNAETYTSDILSGHDGLFVKLAIAGAFYPNYFMQQKPAETRLAVKTLHNKPIETILLKTVFFNGFNEECNIRVYEKEIADFLSHGKDIPVVHSEKGMVIAVYDTSTGDSLGPFSEAMYMCIKRRQIANKPLSIRVLSKMDESKAIERWADTSYSGTIFPGLTLLPRLSEKYVYVQVKHIQSPSQFWVVQQQDVLKFRNLDDRINSCNDKIILSSIRRIPNALCIARYGERFYRARILQDKTIDGCRLVTLVHFIDVGNSEWIPSEELHDFSPTMLNEHIDRQPTMAVECRIEMLQPARLQGVAWSQEAITLMKNKCKDAARFKFRIHSIDNGIMCGDLKIYKDVNGVYIRECLLSKNDSTVPFLGEPAVECPTSLKLALDRELHGKMQQNQYLAANKKQTEKKWNDLDFVFSTRGGQAKEPITLNGPFSPIEIEFKACRKQLNSKPIKIDNLSVASVIFDDDHDKPSLYKMLVATRVNTGSNGNTNELSECTLMPSIQGILPLTAMLFAPMSQLRVDRIRCKYTGVSCGTGYRTIGNTAISHDPDMDINFECEIDETDIDNLNTIRSLMNDMLRDRIGLTDMQIGGRIRTAILQLLSRERTSNDYTRFGKSHWMDGVLPHEPSPVEWQWNKCEREKFNRHDDTFSLIGKPPIWDGGY